MNNDESENKEIKSSNNTFKYDNNFSLLLNNLL